MVHHDWVDTYSFRVALYDELLGTGICLNQIIAKVEDLVVIGESSGTLKGFASELLGVVAGRYL